MPLPYCDGKIYPVEIRRAGSSQPLNRGVFDFQYQPKFLPLCVDVLIEPSLGLRARRILSLLRPETVIGGRMIRMGNDNDGGYVMLDHGLDSTVALSLGISDDVSWDLGMAARNNRILQYDHTITSPPEAHPNFFWKKLGIQGSPAEEGFVTIDSVIRENELQDNNHLVLKMDIEGCEWGVFNSIESAVLQQFSQIVFEAHCLVRLADDALYLSIVGALKTLHKTHQLIHVHANNYGPLVIAGGVPIASAYEFTYVRRNDHEFEECVNDFPTALDRPCNPFVADIYLGHMGRVPAVFDS